MNGKVLIGFFVPKGAISEVQLTCATTDQIADFFDNQLPKMNHIFEFLKDK